MHLEKFQRQLHLLALLAGNSSLPTDVVCHRLHITERTLYRYLEAFRAAGFIVEKEGNIHSISPNSPFFKKITDKVHFTEDEAVTIGRLLNGVKETTPQIRALQQKLSRLHDHKILAMHEVDETLAQNLSLIYLAIKEERMVLLKDYRSGHSQQRHSRIVEPFQLLHGNADVRCYEVSTGQCKTFRIARMGQVELIDLKWSYRAKHMAVFTDVFHFSGERQLPVTLRLDGLASQVLRDEYPDAVPMMRPLGDGHHELSVAVCDYRGIGRFVIGLLSHITVVASADFTNYLREKLADLTIKTAD